MTPLFRTPLPILLVLALILGACAQAPATPTEAPAAAPTNTAVAPTAAPTSTAAPAPTNTTAPIPTNTAAPAPTNTTAPAATATTAAVAPAATKPAAASSSTTSTRGLMEEWLQKVPEFTNGSSITTQGSPDGKFFGVQLTPKDAKANDPSKIIVGVYQSETPAAAQAKLNEMGDAMKADGFTRQDSNDVLGNRPAILGAKGSADASEGYVLFLTNDRVGLIQVALPPANKDALNPALGQLAGSLLVQLDPAGAAQLAAAPAKPAAPAAVAPVAGTPKELLARFLQGAPAITSDATIEEQPGADGKSSLVVLKPKTADPKGLQTLTFGVYQADSVEDAPALLVRLADARKAEGWTIDPTPVAQLGTRATAIGSKDSSGTTTVFLLFQAGDRVGLVQATGPTEMGVGGIGQFVGMASVDLIKVLDPSFKPVSATP